jgi:hypothetical protein
VSIEGLALLGEAATDKVLGLEDAHRPDPVPHAECHVVVFIGEKSGVGNPFHE